MNVVTPGMGKCAVCRCQIAGGMLMCRQHWAQVPTRLKRRVNDALTMWRNGVVSLSNLRAAQEDAVDSVRYRL